MTTTLAPPSPLPSARPAAQPPDPRHRRWAVPLAVLGALCPVAIIAAAMTPSTLVGDKPRCLRYEEVDGKRRCVEEIIEPVEFAIVPAVAEPVGPRLDVAGVTEYGGAGEVLFVTVRTPDLSALEWRIVKNNPAAQELSRFDKFGDQTPQQQQQQSVQSMRSAKQTAEYVAFDRLDLGAELIQGDVVIDGLVCLEANEQQTECVDYAPSDDVLDAGDTLVSLDGQPLGTIDDLTEALEGKKPGDRVEVVYRRDGVEGTGEIELIASPDDAERTIVGFFPSDTATVKLPENIEVDIDTDSVGGPSAGLAFTVTLIDDLSEGDLLGGEQVAITGAIDINGNVGAIGGLSSKASAVLQMGVDFFLVPASQTEAEIVRARKVVGDQVEIIPVATLDEALAALERIGGDPLPPRS
jgi:Lon-like protease